MTKLRWIRSAGAGACVCVLSALLAACAGGAGGTGGSIGLPSGGTGATSPASSGATINLQGVVHGGQSPIADATVTLYEAGPAGGSATVINSTSTVSDGSWSFSGLTNYGQSNACASANSLLYVVASSGNPGAGTNNAINLMAAIGACGSTPSYVVVNELTTVAAVYALNGFAYQSSAPTGTPGSLNGCVDCTPSFSDMTQLNGNAPGITNAFATAAQLADVTTGNPASFLPSSSDCISGANNNCLALEKLTALANSLGACVNTDGPSSLQCMELFECAVPNATYQSGSDACTGGTTAEPSDTLAATLLIARNPGLVSPSGLQDVSTQFDQFAPGLGEAPNDWTIALSYISDALNLGSVAIDAQGNVWVASNNGVDGSDVAEFSPTGVLVTGEPATGYLSGGLNSPNGIAIDLDGHVWVANSGANTVVELTSAGALVSGEPATGYSVGGLSTPTDIAVDPSGNVWVTNAGANSVTELISGGALVAGEPATGYTDIGLDNPDGIAVDRNGNVWIANNASASPSVTELNSSGALVQGEPASGFTAQSLTAESFPKFVAIDPTGDAWITASGRGDGGLPIVTELTPSGAPAAQMPAAGFNLPGEGAASLSIDAGGNVWFAGIGDVIEVDSTGKLLSPTLFGLGLLGERDVFPPAIAVDSSGNVWVVNSSSANYVGIIGGYAPPALTEIVGAAVPTVTPLAAQL